MILLLTLLLIEWFIEIKAVSEITNQHKAQLINYLKATGIKIGLLVNFGEKIEFIRTNSNP